MTINTPEYNKSYYTRHKTNRKYQVLQRQREIKETINELKIKTGCKLCKYKKSPMALHYHHFEDNKEHNIAKMVTQGRAILSIMKEINKCILLCANCHAEEHEHENKLALSSSDRTPAPQAENESLILSRATKSLPLDLIKQINYNLTMKKKKPTIAKGYTCEGFKCGRYHKFPAYVFAHMHIELVHTCECGAKNIIYEGEAHCTNG